MAITGLVNSIKAIDGVTVTTGATKMSDWLDASSGLAYTIFYYQVSSAGTPSHTISVEVSPYNFKYLNDLVTAGTDTVAYYVSATLASSVTTESTLIRYTDTILTTPFKSIRVKVVGGGAATDTVCTAWVVNYQ